MIDGGDDRRRRLGDFLRAQRERLAPAAAGLAITPRRRTPGLRREELALLAGISTTWYTRIEQGRDVSVSAATAGRLADALQLNRAARRHLLTLTGHAESAPPDRGPAELPEALAATIAAIAAPAYALDFTWTARAWNPAAAALFADWLGGAEQNLLRYVFLDPSARRFVVDWPLRARRLLAEFRADTADRASDAAIAALVADLRAGDPLFGLWWDEHQVVEREGGERVFQLPDGTRRHLHQITLIPMSHHDVKLVVLLGLPDHDAPMPAA